MMCKLKRRIEKGGHYDVDMKGWLQQGVIWCTNENVDTKGGIMMCKLKGCMDNGRHYVKINRWMQKVVL